MKTNAIVSHPQDAQDRLSTPRRQGAKAQREVVLGLVSSRPCALALILLPLCLGAATNDLSGLLQRGLFEEEANRNLDAAAQAYQTVSAQFDKDRALAATAIFRLGEIYRKQNKTNEAVGQYERIVREFPDQQALVTLSRQNLAGIGNPSGAANELSSGIGSSPATAEKFDQLQSQYTLLKAQLVQARKETNALVIAKLLSDEDLRATIQAEKQVIRSPESLRKVIDEATQRAFDFAETRLRVLESAIQQSGPGQLKLSDDLPTDDEEKEIRRIQDMIKNSPDLINAPQGGSAPLIRAAAGGQLRVVTFLLDHQADVNLKAGNLNPLLAAAVSGNKAMVELLLSRGADINAKDGAGRTALHTAVASGFVSVAETLLQHKADVNARDSDQNGQQTPLHLAAGAGHSPMMELLLRDGANVNATNRQGETPLMQAAGNGRLEAVKALLAARADVNLQSTSGRTALSFAANGYLDVVTALLEAKADPNAGTLDVPLARAAMNGQIEIAELLLRAGANPNLASKTDQGFGAPGQPFFGGSRGNSPYGPYTPLQIAVSKSDTAMVKLLLKFKADSDVEAPWAPSRSLASYVLRESNMLESFLDTGVDVGASKWESWPLLILSCADNNSKAVEQLLAHGAKANIQSRDGHWPLEFAAKTKCLKCVELLLAAKADVNVRDDIGSTPLFWAVSASSKEIVELLLAHGADPNIANQNGETPLGRCKSGPTLSDVQMKEIAPLLRQHGAVDDLPRRDRIEVRRPSANYAATAFRMDTNNWNEFTLLELVAWHYGLMTADRNAVWDMNKPIAHSQFWRAAACQFPDLGHVVIRRTGPTSPLRTEIPVNLAELLDSGDCSRDIKLKPGDIVEIPEADHPVNERWSGLDNLQLSNLLHCVARTVMVSVKGTPATIQLSPQLKPRFGQEMNELTRGSFMLKSVLAQSRLLRASSDLSRVKVTRHAEVAGKTQEWVFDCGSGNDPEFWLRDGDVIEVPDKP